MKAPNPTGLPEHVPPVRHRPRVMRGFAPLKLLGILLLSACTSKPLVISADTSCERFRHISANDEQIKVFADNWSAMESYADQILAHNAVYDAHCLKEPPK